MPHHLQLPARRSSYSLATSNMWGGMALRCLERQVEHGVELQVGTTMNPRAQGRDRRLLFCRVGRPVELHLEPQVDMLTMRLSLWRNTRVLKGEAGAGGGVGGRSRVMLSLRSSGLLRAEPEFVKGERYPSRMEYGDGRR